jgi:aspartyl-tRNA synthetase
MSRIYTTDTAKLAGQTAEVFGWVDSVRDHGQLIFIDLRDKFGKLQIVVDPEQQKSLWEVAKDLKGEFVLRVKGEIREREEALKNPNVETGSIELVPVEIEVLNKSKPLPFPINTNGHEIDENIRLKYRYLDLRRQRLQEHMHKKHKLILAIRNWMDSRGFTEVITPLLTSTSPEGARDFVVPSRLHPGKFYVLPQAPQQYKQLLMVGGLDKYFQIAPCARDEDPRADRHAGVFYQIDLEMSFPTVDTLFGEAEQLLQNTYQVVAPHKKIAQVPFPRITHAEASERYGSDKPDIRFGLELKTITEVVKGKTEFNIFNQAKVVRAIVAEDCGECSRTQIMEMEEYAKGFGAKGLAYAKVTAEGLDTGISKFLEPVAQDLIAAVGAKPGDLLFFGAGEPNEVNKYLGEVRLRLGDLLKLRDNNVLAFAWITDFPFYEYDEKNAKLDFAHNPFSMPSGGMEAFKAADPLTIQSHQYDLALNGFEVLSGSIRNHDPEVLIKAFEVVGYGKEEVMRRFGGMYNAFQYGAPPHGGWAIGFDRMFMILTEEPNIRDVYAFPMSQKGEDLMMNAPSELPAADMEVLGITHTPKVLKALEASRKN